PATFFHVTVSPAWIVRKRCSKRCVGLSVTVTMWSYPSADPPASKRTAKEKSAERRRRWPMESPFRIVRGILCAMPTARSIRPEQSQRPCQESRHRAAGHDVVGTEVPASAPLRNAGCDQRLDRPEELTVRRHVGKRRRQRRGRDDALVEDPDVAKAKR